MPKEIAIVCFIITLNATGSVLLDLQCDGKIVQIRLGLPIGLNIAMIRRGHGIRSERGVISKSSCYLF